MSYFGGTSRMVGDPGFFSTLGRIAKGAAGVLTGGVSTQVLNAFAPPQRGRQIPTIGGFQVNPRNILPGGKPFIAPGVQPRKKRRRMNVMNTKALKRADRRIDGFVKETKKVLKHTQYKLVTKSSQARRSRRDLGPGHTHVR